MKTGNYKNFMQPLFAKLKQCTRACLISAAFLISAGIVKAQYSYYDVVPLYEKYSFSYNQVPDNIVSIAPLSGSGYTYQWEQSTRPVDGFTSISGATQQNLSFTTALSQTTYFRRKTVNSGSTYYSNTVRLDLVSVNWENLNYVREHDVLVPGQTNWQAIDNLPIGQKLQTTTYLDGIGRPLQKISRETSTRDGNNPWGDMVKFYSYDALGRQPKDYLPYNTTTESGKFKTGPLAEQTAYYSATYNETAAFSNPTYDNSPLNRVYNVKSPGTSWAAGLGNSSSYELNDVSENVQIFSVGYTTGAIPVNSGAYPSNTLYKFRSTDENGKSVIEYVNKSGQSILTKTQLEDGTSLSAAHSGWICTYSVYDEFGLLRYRFQPEAVKWLDINGWSFNSTDGQKVLDELCFRYEYDGKGRVILKKAPGAKELYMIYDKRDRVVFMQDGNQRAKSPGEWTVNIYDELDRTVITTLYSTTKTRAALQSDIDNAGGVNTVSISAQSVTTTTYNNPISSSDLNNPAIATVVKYLFYDGYSYTGVKPFNTSFDNLQAYPTGGEAISPTQRTINMPTGNITRVLNTATFLTGTVYYDDKGRTIQTAEDNIKSGTNTITSQYQWDGRELSSNTKHTAANTGYSNYSIVTKNIFDKIGRVTSIQKKYGANTFKTIANYSFDAEGRLKNKKLDPDYNNTTTGTTGIETLNYSYNIHNEISGINKDYALKTSGNYNKWSNYFGLYLGYDNRDNVFGAAQLDGHVTGLLWNTQGDDAQRKYDYKYDNAGRLINAAYKERQTTSAAWDNSKMDFSVTGTIKGRMLYDLNGNLLLMVQKGVLPGSTTPYTIDNLQYTYAALSNKLLKVTDNGTLGSANGKLGDFADGTNMDDDYVYDDNGNLIIDRNKNATPAAGGTNGIKYNYLDKPYEVHVAGKGTITMVYDANGNKLQKIFTPENGGAIKSTTYINEFIYEGDVLQYINFEEGRLRVMQNINQNNGFDLLNISGNITMPSPPSGGGGNGAFDFFIRDYQGNVRMILTEETHLGSNSCTMEDGRSANEEPLFGQVDANGNPTATNEVAARFKVSAIPGQTSGGGWQNPAIQNAVSRVGALADSKMGPNVLMKVMAGDQISAATIYYYENPVSNTAGSNTLLNTLLQALGSAISGSTVTTGTVKGSAGNITTLLGGSTSFINATSPNAGSSSGNNPKAYLTLLFFDERFNFVEENSQALRVQQSGNGAPSLTLTNIKAPKNGYAYVYVSNEANEMVYFDNLQVTHDRARIIEENHYYAYGLKIAGISSNKMPDLNELHIKNKYLYNDKELIDDADLYWYDYGFRSYDEQIGRFSQLDPLTDEYPELTPFQYASCEPIGNIDVDGLEGTGVTAMKTLQEVIVNTEKTLATTANTFNILKLSVSALKIASAYVRIQIKTNTRNHFISDPSVTAALTQKVLDEYNNPENNLTKLDAIVLYGFTERYFKGLNLMAWWRQSKFEKLDNSVLTNEKVGNIEKLEAVEKEIEDINREVFGVLAEGANSAVTIATMGLFPTVGGKLKAPNPIKVPAGFSIARGFISANKLFGKSGLTIAGRALLKHPHIVGAKTGAEILKVLGTNKAVNEAAADAIKFLIRFGSKTVKTTKQFGRVVDYKLPSGMGVRFGANNTFITFLGKFL